MIADIINFFQDPANSLIIYAISVFLILDGLLLHIVRKKVVNKAIEGGVAVGGDSSAIIGLILAALTFYLSFYSGLP